MSSFRYAEPQTFFYHLKFLVGPVEGNHNPVLGGPPKHVIHVFLQACFALVCSLKMAQAWSRTPSSRWRARPSIRRQTSLTSNWRNLPGHRAHGLKMNCVYDMMSLHFSPMVRSKGSLFHVGILAWEGDFTGGRCPKGGSKGTTSSSHCFVANFFLGFSGVYCLS